ncbi:hypothetical protein DSO57_1008991 [Entomophthora muscae]|uniref:Uncharacterized protein n=1 Tax=Entomophthora muscae TaxID=34485 RepID=A0ACC2TIV4_9FUNG|nr:hypothetical protein DSO57_1008991 [Entomophthora muscae]
MIMVLSLGPAWAPLPAFSLNYEQACAAARSLLHTGTVAMHTIPGLCPGFASKYLYSFLLDFDLPPPVLMESMEAIGNLVNQSIQPVLVHHQLALGSQNHLLTAVAGNCGKFDSLVIDSLVLNKVSSTREFSAAYVNLLVFLA